MKSILDEILIEKNTLPCSCKKCRAAANEIGTANYFEQNTDSEDFEIVGSRDSRKAISIVSKSTFKPFRWICKLRVHFRHPQTNRMVSMDGGTGLLISPNHVLTVGHNIHIDVTINLPGGRSRIVKVPVSFIDVSPGADGSRKPFGTHRSKDIIAHPNWINNRSDTHDFGLITLRSKIGNRTFRSIGNKRLGHWGIWNTFLNPLPKSAFSNRIVNIVGYPKDKGGQTQWISFDKVNNINPVTERGNRPLPQLFLHQVDTCAGHSGAPIWKFDSKTKRRDLVGIHKGTCDGVKGCRQVSGRGCSGSRRRASSNLGVWFSPQVLKTVKSWMRRFP